MLEYVISAFSCNQSSPYPVFLHRVHCDEENAFLCELPLQHFCLNGGSCFCWQKVVDRPDICGGCVCPEGYNGTRCEIGKIISN